MARVFIGIGTNVGDREANIALARRELAELPATRLTGFSEIYETAPVGPIQQGRFLNAAAQLQTELGPIELLDELRRIEHLAGRTPEAKREKWGPRTLDLDILLWDRRVISHDRLVVPHPLMHERWFVLKPLCDLDPTAVHPVLETTVGQLLEYVQQQGDSTPESD